MCILYREGGIYSDLKQRSFKRIPIDFESTSFLYTEETYTSWIGAYDTARAFETILEKGKIGEIYNIGCDEGMEYSVMEVAQKLIREIQHSENFAEWIEYVQDRPYNDVRYYISNLKLKQLGWTIEKDFNASLVELCHFRKNCV